MLRDVCTKLLLFLALKWRTCAWCSWFWYLRELRGDSCEVLRFTKDGLEPYPTSTLSAIIRYLMGPKVYHWVPTQVPSPQTKRHQRVWKVISCYFFSMWLWLYRSQYSWKHRNGWHRLNKQTYTRPQWPVYVQHTAGCRIKWVKFGCQAHQVLTWHGPGMDTSRFEAI